MPLYPFEDENGKIEDFFFKMNDAPKIGSSVDIEGKKWKRLPTLPYASSDSIDGDPFDKKAFLKATNKKGGTFGDMFDLSKEYSERRKEKDGIDLIGQKSNELRKEAYNTIGINPDTTRAELARERLRKLGVTVKENKVPPRAKLSRADKKELKELKKKSRE